MPDEAARNGGSPPLRRGSTSSAVRRSLIDAELGDGDLREVERERDRLAVEVAAADDPPAPGRDRVDVGHPAAGEDERVVGGRVELDVEDAAQVVERVAHRPVDLRHAAQRVRVLDLVGVAVVAGLQAAVAKEVAELGGDRDLARMRPGQLVGGRERDVGAEERLDAHRGGDARRPHEPVRVGQQRVPPTAPIIWVPLSSASPSFARRTSGSSPASRRAMSDGSTAPTELDLAATDERQREVGERREVARRADAALLRHDRVDAPAQHLQEPIHEQRPAAAVAEGQRVGPQEQHRAHHLAREGRPDACRVAHQQVLLEPAGLGRWDRGRGKGAEARRHAVDDGPLRDERLDDVAGLLHPLASVDVERDLRVVAGDRLDVRDGQVGAGQDHDPGHATVRVEVRDLRLAHPARIVGYAPPRPLITVTRFACSPSSTRSSSRS